MMSETQVPTTTFDVERWATFRLGELVTSVPVRLNQAWYAGAECAGVTAESQGNSGQHVAPATKRMGKPGSLSSLAPRTSRLDLPNFGNMPEALPVSIRSDLENVLRELERWIPPERANVVREARDRLLADFQGYWGSDAHRTLYRELHTSDSDGHGDILSRYGIVFNESWENLEPQRQSYTVQALSLLREIPPSYHDYFWLGRLLGVLAYQPSLDSKVDVAKRSAQLAEQIAGLFGRTVCDNLCFWQTTFRWHSYEMFAETSLDRQQQLVWELSYYAAYFLGQFAGPESFHPPGEGNRASPLAEETSLSVEVPVATAGGPPLESGYLGLLWNEKSCTLGRKGYSKTLSVTSPTLQKILKFALRQRESLCRHESIKAFWGDQTPENDAYHGMIHRFNDLMAKLNCTFVSSYRDGYTLLDLDEAKKTKRTTTKKKAGRKEARPETATQQVKRPRRAKKG